MKRMLNLFKHMKTLSPLRLLELLSDVVFMGVKVKGQSLTVLNTWSYHTFTSFKAGLADWFLPFFHYIREKAAVAHLQSMCTQWGTLQYFFFLIKHNGSVSCAASNTTLIISLHIFLNIFFIQYFHINPKIVFDFWAKSVRGGREM